MQLAKTDIDEAHERTNRILRIKQAAGFLCFALGEEFQIVKSDYETNRQTAYELYGFESFEQYVAQPGLAYSVTSVNRFIRLYQKYCVELGVPKEHPDLKSIDYTILDKLSRFVDKENVNDWLRRAVSMGRRDLALMTRNEDETCEHKIFDKFELCVCRECGDHIGKRKL